MTGVRERRKTDPGRGREAALQPASCGTLEKVPKPELGLPHLGKGNSILYPMGQS